MRGGCGTEDGGAKADQIVDEGMKAGRDSAGAASMRRVATPLKHMCIVEAMRGPRWGQSRRILPAATGE